MADRLEEYRRRRDAARTPEPVPERAPAGGGAAGGRFVIQQHHARSLHWDLRLEHDGVLASWAVPRGLPRDSGRNHLAVHTEDHPMEYLDFAGEIPRGEYGGGTMVVHDRGTYRCEKWRADEVIVVLDGERTSGRYVLFAAGGRDGRDWLVRRTDPPSPGWTSMPELVRPMHPTPAAALPKDQDRWGYELRWDGVRAVAYVSGGRLRLLSDTDEEITGAYPWLRDMAEALAPTEAVLDGVLVRIDRGGRVRGARAGRAAADAQYLLVDLLWLEGVTSVDLPYAQRRELLDGLALAGPHWQTPPWFPGTGAEALRTAREQGLPGVVAKRLDSAYEPGRRSRRWQSVDGG
ncbi:DNA polymerase ligase N-terminal domain-containing protein [Micromonospora endolithica]|uniref:ATP-dependent DNA ligase n=1 Tax=Micromonospora endolithica TaxID=230091 RepID=A0A3A9ZMK7_9ACTN|nr:DNA polymerase ligase N-terminal domain-containing protein [Micromonospora endolithica]RKN49540.1 ATP-dependent DNA ligase [Micromonospora endolithica]TWJ23755.1 bifunctional non-homologous end joining protein LigD [Micromonospora endolithica]